MLWHRNDHVTTVRKQHLLLEVKGCSCLMMSPMPAKEVAPLPEKQAVIRAVERVKRAQAGE